MISLRDNTDPNSGDSKAGVVTIQILRGAFEGMTGHQPRSDQELNEWLATDEGKEATIFEATALSILGATRHGRSYEAAAWSRGFAVARCGEV